MKLWLLTQKENSGYDTYDSCVVVAENARIAKFFDPNGHDWRKRADKFNNWSGNRFGSTWASRPAFVQAKCIGEADKRYMKSGTVIIASFNAG